MNGSLDPWILHRKVYMGICTQIKTAGRKVASTKQFFKVMVHCQSERLVRFQEVEQALHCFGNWILLGFCGQGGTGRYSEVVSHEAVSSHLRDSSERLGGKFLTLRGLFLAPGRLWWGVQPQCKHTIMSLAVTLGRRWKRRPHALLLWLLIYQP